MGGFDLYRDMVGVLEGAALGCGETCMRLAGRFWRARRARKFQHIFCYLLAGTGCIGYVRMAPRRGKCFQPVFEGELDLVTRLHGGQIVPLEPFVALMGEGGPSDQCVRLTLQPG